MTNYEKYKNEIDKVWEAKSTLAFSNGEIKSCCVTRCSECEFSDHGNCTTQMAKWLVSEYKEPQVDWSKVPVDTPILVKDYIGGEWYRRHFAEYRDGRVFVWNYCGTSWVHDNDKSFTCDYKYAKLAEEEE